MRIDLHTHSDASDGTDRPAALVRAAAAVGLTTVALTDHDTFGGVQEAVEAGRSAGVEVVPGVEISCAVDGISLHLLGYWPDPEHTALAAELLLNRDDRVPRAQEIVRRLAAAGYPISWSDVETHVSDGATVGRPAHRRHPGDSGCRPSTATPPSRRCSTTARRSSPLTTPPTPSRPYAW